METPGNLLSETSSFSRLYDKNIIEQFPLFRRGPWTLYTYNHIIVRRVSYDCAPRRVLIFLYTRHL